MTRRISGAEWAPFVVGAGSLDEGPSGEMTPHRLTRSARNQIVDPLFSWVEACPAGVRLRFHALGETSLTLRATVLTRRGEPPAPVVLVALRGGEETEIEVPEPRVLVLDDAQRVVDVIDREPCTVRIPSGGGTTEVFLPHHARIDLVSLEAEDLRVAPALAARRWTHYGSSISQGMNARTVMGSWPLAAARRLGWSLRHLGLAGNAQLDGAIARVIRDEPADIITLKVGINLINADSMRERTFRPAAHAFLDTVREGHPSTPIVLISAVSCPVHEDAPGPTVTDENGRAAAPRRGLVSDQGALTLARSREILREVVDLRDDTALHYLDGRELLGPDDAAHLYDGLHPDETGLALIAERFVPRVGAVVEGRTPSALS